MKLKPKTYLRIISAAAVAGFTAACANSGAAKAAKSLPDNPGTQRNVLFIAVDDLRTQLNAYGKTYVISPNIDRLVRDGIVFEKAYCQQALCSPSRSSILSGMRPDSTGISGNTVPLRDNHSNPNSYTGTGLSFDKPTLSQMFKAKGYRTVSIGKVYHHANDDAASWDIRYRSNVRTYQNPDSLPLVGIKLDEDRVATGPAFERADVEDNKYRDGANTDFAISQLDSLKNGPFFLAVGFHKPHLPFNAPAKYWDMYDPSVFQLADNRNQEPTGLIGKRKSVFPFKPDARGSFEIHGSGEIRGYAGIPAWPARIPDELAREIIHAYHAAVSYMDAQLGRLLDEMDKRGLLDNTVIILWGDNGYKLSEHGWWNKATNYEPDTNVPLILSTPELRGKSMRTKALVELVDIYPSLCDLVGFTKPRHLEGDSFVPLLSDPNRPWKQAAFSQYPSNGRNVTGYAMHTEKYRYTEWITTNPRNNEFGSVLERTLFDLQTDPAENHNVYDNPAYSAIRGELSAVLNKGQGWKTVRPSAH